MRDNPTPKLVFVVAELGYFLSHRLPTARAAKRAGFAVHVLTNCPATIPSSHPVFSEFTIHHIGRLKRKASPIASLVPIIAMAWRLRTRLKAIRPQAIHSIALYPSIITLFAIATLIKPPHHTITIAGLGYAFVSQSLSASIMRVLVKGLFALPVITANKTFIFQNEDDPKQFPSLARKKSSTLLTIRGSGVDPKQFPVTPLPPIKTNRNTQPNINHESKHDAKYDARHDTKHESKHDARFRAKSPLIIATACRLLTAKGIHELATATDHISNINNTPLHLRIAGDIDAGNPGGLPPSLIRPLKQSLYIEWLGYVKDMRKFWGECHVAALLSYGGEGLPMALLQALAMGRPILTTHSNGCRDLIALQAHDDPSTIRQDKLYIGKNGILVPPRNTATTISALKHLATADLAAMSRHSQKHFQLLGISSTTIEQAHFAHYESLRQSPQSHTKSHP